MILVVPFLPLFPVAAAGPARHDKDPLLVGEIEEVIAHDLAFQPHRVQVHVFDVLQLLFFSERRLAKQHVWRVPGAANENSLSVDTEDAMRLGVTLVVAAEHLRWMCGLFYLTGYFPNAKICFALVRIGSADLELQL